MHKLKAKPSLKKLKGIAKKGQSDSSGDDLEYDVRYPVNCYLREYRAFTFLGWTDKSVLYDRPFFMVLGPEGSGKTSLFSSTDIRFPLQYPSKDDGYIAGESVQPPVVWYCNENAVWLDLPGYMLTDERKKCFHSITDQLENIRKKRPTDGVVITVSCAFFLGSTVDEINESAQSLRETVDVLIKKWGMELPVYLIFTHTDIIPGFEALFSDETGNWNKRILGTSFTEHQDTEYPYTTFLIEFNKIQLSIEQIRIQMIPRENKAERRLALCQFPIVFNILRDRLAPFIATLFQTTSPGEKPVLSGFYFTSIKTVTEEKKPSDSIGDSLGALFDHPLNPQYGRKAGKSSHGKKPATWFTRPLITKLIPESIPPVNATGSRYRRNLFLFVLKLGSAALLSLTFLVVLLLLSASITTHEKHIRTLVATKPTFSEEGIEPLWLLYNEYDSCTKKATAKPPLPELLTGYNSTRTHAAVTQHLLTNVQETLLNPCFAAIGNSTDQKHLRELSFEQLKNNLHIYLALSSYRSCDELVDSTIYRNDKNLARLIGTFVEKQMYRSGRMDRKIYKKLLTLIRNQIQFLKTGRVPNTPAADENAIDRMQEALSRKSSEQVMFQQVLELCAQETDSMLTLADIISEDISPETAILNEALPVLFTPEGWKTYVYPRIMAMSEHVTAVDTWLLGPYKTGTVREPVDTSALKVNLYRDYLDLCAQQWFSLLSSFSIPSFTTIQDAEQKLQILSGKSSPVLLLLSRLVEWSEQFTADDTLAEFSAAADSFKKEVAFIRTLAEEFFPDYQKSLAAIAQGCSESVSIAETFNNAKNDPLLACNNVVNTSIVPNFQQHQKTYIGSLLNPPLEHLEHLLAIALPKELNTIWKDHIFSTYADALKNRYPVQDTPEAKECPFNDVIDFFHPQDGYINRFKMQYLSGWLSDKTSSQIPVHITPNGQQCLKKAERITKLFYKNASLRSWDISLKSIDPTVTAVIYNLNTRQPPDTVISNVKKLFWPGDTYGTITFIRNDPMNSVERRYPYNIEGSWALMRLLNRGAVYQGTYNISPFTCKITLQSGGKDITVTMKADISTTIHPFCMNPFSGFFVPEEIVEEGKVE